MAKHPNAPRRAHDDPEDRFVASVLSASDWLKRNSRAVTVTAIALFVLVAGTLYWVRYQRALREAASAELNTIRQTVASGNTPLALRDLSAFLESFGGTPSGAEGRLIMAQLLLTEGRNDEALDAVRPLARDLDDPLATNAARLIAAAHEQAERWTDAEAEYLRISEEAPYPFQRNQALADAARVRLLQGDPAGAAELYRRALQSVPEDDPQAPILRLRLGEAEAQAASSGA